MVGGSPDNYQGAPRYEKALRENEGPFVFLFLKR
jgi:hypothetical protein